VPVSIDMCDAAAHEGIASNTYYDWSIRHAYMVVPTQEPVARFVKTFKEFPPRQRPTSFSVEQIMDLLSQPEGGEGVGSGR
jgi:arylsulfatase